jgi:phage terminase large subunit-like protein
VNSITDIFASGMVYAPKEKHFAQHVIEQCAAFPAGDHDDYVDTVQMAVSRFRNGGWVGSANDYEDDEKEFYVKSTDYY